MSGRFVPVKLVPPPKGQTLMVRSGGSVFSAAIRPFDGKWHLLYGSKEEAIPCAPDEWWVDDEMAQALGIDIAKIEAQARSTDRSGQGLLFAQGNDSGRQSGGDS